MTKDDLLAQMLTKSAHLGGFGDWADVMGEYADCLWIVREKLGEEELARLVAVGAKFYRTLVRAENYRHMSVRRS